MNYLDSLCQRAKNASKLLRGITETEKNEALLNISDALIKNTDKILEENKKDIEKAIETGMAKGLIDRLTLTKERIVAISDGVKQVASLPDPIGEVREEKVLENGLKIGKKVTPLGVVGVIYESRPNVTVDTASLCLKSSNAVVLRGGSDAFNSNKILVSIMKDALEKSGVCPDAVNLIEDLSRETATEFMKKNEYLDVLIPRGGASLIQSVVKNATVPVIETGVGNCHTFVDESADTDMAIQIIVNAKTSRPSVCNALESLLIHKNVPDEFFKKLEKALAEKGVEMRGCERFCEKVNSAKKATEEDWGKEFLSLCLSAKIVDSTIDAIEHIDKYSTGHSECIITKSEENANLFLERVDSAAVYVNASTRFTDGFEFGLGAEIGISTQKLHARGPMGICELTTYKYVILGNGQVR